MLFRSRIQSDLGMDSGLMEGEINEDGTVNSDPALRPVIIHKHLAQPAGGYGSTETMTVRYKVVFYTEWFNRRRKLSDVRTEA